VESTQNLMERNAQHSLTLPTANKNEDNLCMPLAINVVLRYWGEETIIDEALKRSKQYDGIEGSIFMEGIEIAESHGYVTYIYKGNLFDLKKRIDQGIPLIVIMPGIQETVQHATIVSGYSADERRIFTYIPEPNTEGAFPEDTFVNYWNQDGTVSIMIIPTEIRSRITESELELRESYRMCFEAERFIQKRNSDNAITLLKKALTLDRSNSLAWSLLGSVYNELGSDEAIKHFEKSIELNPKFYLSYRGMGNYYLKRGEYLLAERYYSNAIDLHEYRFGPIYKNRAIARLNMERKQEAKSDLLRYLEQCPSAKDKTQIETSLNTL
jgi:tetratricopeptide (TPR) repeat protein